MQRLFSADEMLRSFARLPLAIGVTRLADITGLDICGLPVVSAIRPYSRSLSVATGRGATSAEARLSALLEAAEAYHAETCCIPRQTTSYAALAADGAIDPRDFLRQPGTEADFDADIEWCAGVELTTGRSVWVPLESVSLDSVDAHGYRPALYRSSNGLAAGGSRTECVLHGLYEVVERDALALWSHGIWRDTDDRQVRLGAIRDPLVAGWVERARSVGVRTIAWDMTSDIGIPAYIAMVVQEPAPSRVIGACSGTGADLSPIAALRAAVSEALQSRTGLISGARDDLLASKYTASSAMELLSSLWQLAERDGTRTVSEAQASVPIDKEIAGVMNALSTACEGSVYVVDLTQPDIGLPVCKVIVPGLEGPPEVSLAAPGPRARRFRAAA